MNILEINGVHFIKFTALSDICFQCIWILHCNSAAVKNTVMTTAVDYNGSDMHIESMCFNHHLWKYQHIVHRWRPFQIICNWVNLEVSSPVVWVDRSFIAQKHLFLNLIALYVTNVSRTERPWTSVVSTCLPKPSLSLIQCINLHFILQVMF
jgi:hypothetical protein